METTKSRGATRTSTTSEEADAQLLTFDTEECEKLSRVEVAFPTAAPVPEGLTPRAREARERFQAAYRARLERATSIALSILIWGPGLGSPSPVAKKRVCIRHLLIKRGHNAFFSEELTDELPPGTLKVAEFAQAIEADLIIALLEDALGTVAEISDFGNHPEIAPNVLVLCPSRFKSGYLGAAPLSIIEDGFGGVHWYEPDEIESCNVLNRALRCAEARRYVRAFMEDRRA